MCSVSLQPRRVWPREVFGDCPLQYRFDRSGTRIPITCLPAQIGFRTSWQALTILEMVKSRSAQRNRP